MAWPLTRLSLLTYRSSLSLLSSLSLPSRLTSLALTSHGLRTSGLRTSGLPTSQRESSLPTVRGGLDLGLGPTIGGLGRTPGGQGLVPHGENIGGGHAAGPGTALLGHQTYPHGVGRRTAARAVVLVLHGTVAIRGLGHRIDVRHPLTVTRDIDLVIARHIIMTAGALSSVSITMFLPRLRPVVSRMILMM